MVCSFNRKVFVVHGYENHAKEMMASFLEKNDFETIFVHEQAKN